MRNIQLDPEEQNLLESIDKGEWQPVPDMQAEIQRYQRYATAVQNKQFTLHYRCQPRKE